MSVAPPCRADETIDCTPSTWTSASSNVSTISFSTTSGAAPSQFTETVIVGKSTSGNWLIPIREPATRPKITVEAISIHASTGRRMQISVRFIGRRFPPSQVRSRRPALRLTP